MAFKHKTIKKINLLLITAVCLYVLLDVYIFLAFYIGKDYSTYKYLSEPESIKIKKDVSPEVLKAYEVVYPGSSKNHVYPDIIWYLLARKNINTHPQFNLAYNLTHTSKLKLLSAANYLDNNLSPEQCISIYLNDFDYSNNVIGIEAAAKYYYDKNLDELSEKEYLELIVMTDNPVYLNKFTHPDHLQKKVQKYLGKKIPII